MGYDRQFLGTDVAPPVAPGDGGHALDYTHFSLSQNTVRRLAWWVAWNIDGERLFPGDSITRAGLRFRPDSRLGPDEQTTDAVYAGNRLDRGHVARRADLLWGSVEEARQANSDSFFFPNITPQMDDFNQERLGGSWGLLEAAVLSQEGLAPRRLSLFGGPVLAPDDPPYRGLVQVPREHWKVITYRLDGELRCRCFVLTQQLDLTLRPVTGYLDEFDTYAVSVAALEVRTGVRFPGLSGAAQPSPAVAGAGPALVTSALDVTW